MGKNVLVTGLYRGIITTRMNESNGDLADIIRILRYNLEYFGKETDSKDYKELPAKVFVSANNNTDIRIYTKDGHEIIIGFENPNINAGYIKVNEVKIE